MRVTVRERREVRNDADSRSGYFEYDAATPTNLLVARCPLDGFGTGRHRLAVRPDGSIELHWLENDRVTGYMIFSQCAPTATGGCS